jgi:hypothetical protein
MDRSSEKSRRRGQEDLVISSDHPREDNVDQMRIIRLTPQSPVAVSFALNLTCSSSKLRSTTPLGKELWRAASRNRNALGLQSRVGDDRHLRDRLPQDAGNDVDGRGDSEFTPSRCRTGFNRDHSRGILFPCQDRLLESKRPGPASKYG